MIITALDEFNRRKFLAQVAAFAAPNIVCRRGRTAWHLEQFHPAISIGPWK